MRKLFTLLAIVLLGLNAGTAAADIERKAFPSENGMRLVWWPNVEVPDAWEQDYDSSVANAINILVPAGQTFSNAETIIYARAVYLDPEGEPKTLDELIAEDFDGHRAFDPSVQIESAESLQLADDSEAVSYTFFPAGEGNWERVAYASDSDFFLLFVVSSRTKQGYEDALPGFEAAVRSYTREPDADASE